MENNIGFYELNYIFNKTLWKKYTLNDVVIKKRYSLAKRSSVKIDGTHLGTRQVTMHLQMTKSDLLSEKVMTLWCKRAVCMIMVLYRLPAIEYSLSCKVDFNPHRRSNKERLSDQFYKKMGSLFIKENFRALVKEEMSAFLKENAVEWSDMPITAFILPKTIGIKGSIALFNTEKEIRIIQENLLEGMEEIKKISKGYF